MKLDGIPADRDPAAPIGTDAARLIRPHPCRFEGGGGIGRPSDSNPFKGVAPLISVAFNIAAEGTTLSLAVFTPLG